MQKIKGIACDECRVVLYIQSGRPDVIPKSTFPNLCYCPVCGQKSRECNDLNDAFYQSMSYHYGLSSEAMRQMFRMYVSTLAEQNTLNVVSFDTWFKKIIQEATQ